MGSKRWVKLRPSPEIVDCLRRGNGLPRVVATLLAGRGVTPDKVDNFLSAPLRGLGDPMRIPGVELAAARLWEAVGRGERILIHGDYDTDGVTAAVLLEWVLNSNGALASTFLPHRFDDGYGFTPESLNKALADIGGPCGLLVTVDCGVTSSDAVREANRRGIDVIITDHHETNGEIPPALAVINPKLHADLADLQVLSGVGVAFKLCHGFIKYGRAMNLGGFVTDLQETLDLVALGTVADIVPLLNENRIMVKHGMRILGKRLRPGVAALVETARLRGQVKTSDITFKLAPRLNAAGRLGAADKALALLQSQNITEAFRHADELEACNVERQITEESIFNEARAQIADGHDLANSLSILVAGEGWHQGVIGIVASRLSREYNRPAIVLTIQGREAYGSGRSVGKLNLVETLTRCSDLLDRFGGHPMAVGLGLKAANIPELFKRFEKVVEGKLSPEDLIDRISVDDEITIDEIDNEYFEFADQIGPFGHSNPQPVFMLRNIEPTKMFPVGNNHTKGYLRDEHGASLGFIAFNRPVNTVPRTKIDILATPAVNEYNGQKTPQLQIVDLRPSL